MNKISIFLLPLLFCGCVNFSKTPTPSDIQNTETSEQNEQQAIVKPEPKQSQKNDKKKVEISKKGQNLLELMDDYLGKRDGGDCSGFVSLINRNFGKVYFTEKQLSKFYTKNGLKSEAMFELFESKGLISLQSPQIGDLIFFNNTTKNTKNNKKSQIITHVGIISSIDDDGRVGFTHNTRGKNAVHYMQLNDKNTHKIGKKEINSYIVSCKNKSVSCLTSNRFSGFGKANIR